MDSFNSLKQVGVIYKKSNTIYGDGGLGKMCKKCNLSFEWILVVFLYGKFLQRFKIATLAIEVSLSIQRGSITKMFECE